MCLLRPFLPPIPLSPTGAEGLERTACALSASHVREREMPARPSLNVAALSDRTVVSRTMYPGVFPWRGVVCIGRVSGSRVAGWCVFGAGAA